MSEVKTRDEIAVMSQGGKILAQIRDSLLTEVKIGQVPLQIDRLAQQLIKKAGGKPSFMTVNNYRWATCISVNDGVVHGVPTAVPFAAGDIVSLDVGFLYKSFHTDTSWSKYLAFDNDAQDREHMRFLNVGEQALKLAIAQAWVGNRVGHISKVIQTTVEAAGFSVVKSLVGHGVGKKLHETPQIPGVLNRSLSATPELKAGMVLAIEVIYAQGSSEITYGNNDGWTLVTRDGSKAGLFEQTVLVWGKGPIILTQS